MKRLLAAVCVLTALASSAADAAKPKTAAKKPAFEAYAAGEWKPLDNRKGHLRGPKLAAGDLRLQPVMVVRFNPNDLYDGEDREKHPEKFIGTFEVDRNALPKRCQFVSVPTRALMDEDLAKKNFYGRVAALPGSSWYADFGLVKEPENTEKAFPFFYVVSTKGEVVYAGCNASQALGAVNRDLAAQGEPHPIFGFVKPDIHAAIVGEVKLGDDVSKIIKKLQPLAAAKGESDSKTEARNLLDAYEQSKTYWAKVLAKFAGTNPPLAIVYAKLLYKTFARDKVRFAGTFSMLMANPTVAKVGKIYEKLYAFKEKMPEKKGDVAKAYQIALQGEKMCTKARRESGDNMPAVYMRLEELVMEVKAELEARGATAKK